ncbi:50S ribosomal protein L9 [Candidatus Gracilibacteria bacterium]|nr:50S ribosomal protein L9 [Candidatus Gracilibacteria bacterium]
MPAHKITVEILSDIAHIGRKGAIIEVSAPQARNSLIPGGLAREITPDRLAKIEGDKKKSQDQARQRLEQAFEIQRQLDGQELDFTLKGKGKKVFGGLDEHTVGTRVNEKYNIKFEKKDIKLPNGVHIKTAGRHLVYLHITRDTLAKIFITVTIDEK